MSRASWVATAVLVLAVVAGCGDEGGQEVGTRGSETATGQGADEHGRVTIEGQVDSVAAGNGIGYILVDRSRVLRLDPDGELAEIAEIPGVARAETTVAGSLLATTFRCLTPGASPTTSACARIAAEVYLVSPDGATDRTELYVQDGELGETDSLGVESVTPEEAWVKGKARLWPVTPRGVGEPEPTERAGVRCGIDQSLYAVRVSPSSLRPPPADPEQAASFPGPAKGAQVLRMTESGFDLVDGGSLEPNEFGMRDVVCDGNSLVALSLARREVAKWTPSSGWVPVEKQESRVGDLGTADITTSTSDQYTFDRSSGALRRGTAESATEPVLSFSVPPSSPGQLPMGGLWVDDAGRSTLVACLQPDAESRAICDVTREQ